ncbi:MAG: hypothetical protein RSE13_18060 [Planktothrix sp. GU0601_MAG3]|nr:MAG: hypothetical protein RSE13_18060 [Planktothrix sp. GU0601_MAG3]
MYLIISSNGIEEREGIPTRDDIKEIIEDDLLEYVRQRFTDKNITLIGGDTGGNGIQYCKVGEETYTGKLVIVNQKSKFGYALKHYSLTLKQITVVKKELTLL